MDLSINHVFQLRVSLRAMSLRCWLYPMGSSAGDWLVALLLAQIHAFKLDRIDRECDQLFVAVLHLDSEIERLTVAMEGMSQRTEGLFREQASLEPQLVELARRVFWSNLWHARSFRQFRSILLAGSRR